MALNQTNWSYLIYRNNIYDENTIGLIRMSDHLIKFRKLSWVELRKGNKVVNSNFCIRKGIRMRANLPETYQFSHFNRRLMCMSTY